MREKKKKKKKKKTMERNSENKSTDNGLCMCAETRSNILFKQRLTAPSKMENKNS